MIFPKFLPFSDFKWYDKETILLYDEKGKHVGTVLLRKGEGKVFLSPKKLLDNPRAKQSIQTTLQEIAKEVSQ